MGKNLAALAIVVGTVLIAAGIVSAHRNDPGRSVLLLVALTLLGLFGQSLVRFLAPRRWKG